MSMRISGKNMHFSMGDYKLKAQKVSLSITDNSAVNKTSGVPDGYVDGDVEASGEMELTTQQFNQVSKAAEEIEENFNYGVTQLRNFFDAIVD